MTIDELCNRAWAAVYEIRRNNVDHDLFKVVLSHEDFADVRIEADPKHVADWCAHPPRFMGLVITPDRCLEPGQVRLRYEVDA